MVDLDRRAALALIGPLQQRSADELKVTRHLSSGELLSLGTGFINVLPNPGAGKVNRVINWAVRVNVMGDAYASSGEVNLAWAGRTGTVIDSLVCAFDATAGQYQQESPSTGINALAGCEGQVVGVFLTAPIASGDGTADLFVTYAVDG